ncbi:hypothetical protein CYMTET_13093, partial [Cymbomonas tetramitiformis]
VESAQEPWNYLYTYPGIPDVTTTQICEFPFGQTRLKAHMVVYIHNYTFPPSPPHPPPPPVGHVTPWQRKLLQETTLAESETEMVVQCRGPLPHPHHPHPRHPLTCLRRLLHHLHLHLVPPLSHRFPLSLSSTPPPRLPHSPRPPPHHRATTEAPPPLPP